MFHAFQPVNSCSASSGFFRRVMLKIELNGAQVHGCSIFNVLSDRHWLNRDSNRRFRGLQHMAGASRHQPNVRISFSWRSLLVHINIISFNLLFEGPVLFLSTSYLKVQCILFVKPSPPTQRAETRTLGESGAAWAWLDPRAS